jgi:hypothetical protein
MGVGIGGPGDGVGVGVRSGAGHDGATEETTTLIASAIVGMSETSARMTQAPSEEGLQSEGR